MDEGNRKRGQKGFPQNREKNNCRLYTMGKLTENKGILSTNEEKGRNIPYLSTTYPRFGDKLIITGGQYVNMQATRCTPYTDTLYTTDCVRERTTGKIRGVFG